MFSSCRLFWLVFAAATAATGQPSTTDHAAAIAAVIQAGRELDDLPFAAVVEAATGRRIIPIDLTREGDRELLRKLGLALDEVLRRLNDSGNPARQEKRINEVSRYLEDELRAVLNATPGLSCDFPRTADGHAQRSGYPDLRLVDHSTGAVLYLDPKLFETGSRDSSFRTFYYEPQLETSKILDDAHHLIAGIEHDGGADGHWRLLAWDLIDVSSLRVNLKAEFQSSNRELYRPELRVGTSRSEP